jgi:hypothetical protein
METTPASVDGPAPVYRFSCKACRASREVQLSCEPKDVELHGSFIRCPACFASDRANWALYWSVLAIKMLLLAGLFSAIAALTTPFLWVLPPLGVAALWADHRRFVRRLDLEMMDAVVKGGPPGERLPRP